MRIRKDKMIAAIDQIVADADKRTAAYDKAAVTWEKERMKRWLQEEKPKWRELQKLISSKPSVNQVVTFDEVVAIFGRGRYDDSIKLTAYHPNLRPPNPLELNDGRKFYKPTGIDLQQMHAMKKLLEAIEDDVVTDHALAKLGVKNVTPIFRAAVELGGLVA
jgi:hypothetical protein